MQTQAKVSLALLKWSNPWPSRRFVINRSHLPVLCLALNMLTGCELATSALVETFAVGAKHVGSLDGKDLTLDDAVPENTIVPPNFLDQGDVVSIAFLRSSNPKKAHVVVTLVVGRTQGGSILLAGRPGVPPVKIIYNDALNRYRVSGGNKAVADKRPSKVGEYLELEGDLRVRKF